MKINYFNKNLNLEDIELSIENLSCSICNDILHDWSKQIIDANNIILYNYCCGNSYKIHLNLELIEINNEN